MQQIHPLTLNSFCTSMGGLVPISGLQFQVDGRELQSEGLQRWAAQIGHSHLG